MEKNRKYEKKEEKESGERVEISGEERKKEGKEQIESDGGKKMFWVRRIRLYGQLLQEWRKGGTSTGVPK